MQLMAMAQARAKIKGGEVGASAPEVAGWLAEIEGSTRSSTVTGECSRRSYNALMVWKRTVKSVEWADDNALETLAIRLAESFGIVPPGELSERQIQMLRLVEANAWEYLCNGSRRLPKPKEDVSSWNTRRRLASGLKPSIKRRIADLAEKSPDLVTASAEPEEDSFSRLLRSLIVYKRLPTESLKSLIELQSHGFVYGSACPSADNYFFVAYSVVVDTIKANDLNELAEGFSERGLLPEPTTVFKDDYQWDPLVAKPAEEPDPKVLEAE